VLRHKLSNSIHECHSSRSSTRNGAAVVVVAIAVVVVDEQKIFTVIFVLLYSVHYSIVLPLMYILPSSVLHCSVLSLVSQQDAVEQLIMHGPNFSTHPLSRRLRRTKTSTGYGAAHVNTFRFCAQQNFIG